MQKSAKKCKKVTKSAFSSFLKAHTLKRPVGPPQKVIPPRKSGVTLRKSDVHFPKLHKKGAGTGKVPFSSFSAKSAKVRKH